MIPAYDLEVTVPPCDPGSARLVAKARLAVDIAPALPYLNATLPGASYLPEANALTWEDHGRAVAFHAHEIAVADVADREEAVRVVDDLVRLVNRTWRRRGELTPSVAARRRPTPMAVYAMLPRTDCKECGLAGCWQFALRLVVRDMEIGDCPPLGRPEHAAHLDALGTLLAPTGTRR